MIAERDPAVATKDLVKAVTIDKHKDEHRNGDIISTYVHKERVCSYKAEISVAGKGSRSSQGSSYRFSFKPLRYTEFVRKTEISSFSLPHFCVHVKKMFNRFLLFPYHIKSILRGTITQIYYASIFL